MVLSPVGPINTEGVGTARYGITSPTMPMGSDDVSGEIEILGIVAAHPCDHVGVFGVGVAQKDAVPFEICGIGGGRIQQGGHDGKLHVPRHG